MSWDRNSLRAPRLAAAALLLCTAGAAMADVLVVRATGPSARNFPAGKSLADNARITLQANDQLVILNKKGTRTLRGPGTFTPTGPAAGAAQIAAAQPRRRARIGAVRGITVAPAASPSLWHVDVARSTNFCLADARDAQLWRADSSRPVTLTISGGGKSRKLAWAAGQSALAWPSDLPIAEGRRYDLNWDGASAPTAVKFRMLGGKSQDTQQVASSLIALGCEAQLDLLIASTAKDPDAPSSG